LDDRGNQRVSPVTEVGPGGRSGLRVLFLAIWSVPTDDLPRCGVTERYYALAARAVELPDPGAGQPDVRMRHAVADLEAPAGGGRFVQLAHLRLTGEQFAELGARLEALAQEYWELSDPSLPDVSLAFALFRPAPREQPAGDSR
jgi:hypothetical protein